MDTFGIRKAKAILSELVRAATRGECSLISDNRVVVAMIGPPPMEPTETQTSPLLESEPAPLSNAAAFCEALFAAPHPLELDF